MKKIMITCIALFATSVQAESGLIVEQVVDMESTALAAQSESSTSGMVMSADSDKTTTNLWNILDIDEDGFLSKSEAASFKDISENWDSVDINQDEKIDAEEFVKVFPSEG